MLWEGVSVRGGGGGWDVSGFFFGVVGVGYGGVGWGEWGKGIFEKGGGRAVGERWGRGDRMFERFS